MNSSSQSAYWTAMFWLFATLAFLAVEALVRLL
jgi:hypothetical protein